MDIHPPKTGELAGCIYLLKVLRLRFQVLDQLYNGCFCVKIDIYGDLLMVNRLFCDFVVLSPEVDF